MRPEATEYPAYFEQYIHLVPDGKICTILSEQLTWVDTRLQSISEEKGAVAYAEGKWTPKELLGHLNDAERIFTFRALSIAREELQPLPGFDENDYVAYGAFNQRSMSSLIEEWRSIRSATLTLTNSFTERALKQFGVSNSRPITTNALLWVIAGHTIHHMNVLENRYGL